MVASSTIRCVSGVLDNPQELLAAQCVTETNISESYKQNRLVKGHDRCTGMHYAFKNTNLGHLAISSV